MNSRELSKKIATELDELHKIMSMMIATTERVDASNQKSLKAALLADESRFDRAAIYLEGPCAFLVALALKQKFTSMLEEQGHTPTNTEFDSHSTKHIRNPFEE